MINYCLNSHRPLVHISMSVSLGHCMKSINRWHASSSSTWIHMSSTSYFKLMWQTMNSYHHLFPDPSLSHFFEVFGARPHLLRQSSHTAHRKVRPLRSHTEQSTMDANIREQRHQIHHGCKHQIAMTSTSQSLTELWVLGCWYSPIIQTYLLGGPTHDLDDGTYEG